MCAKSTTSLTVPDHFYRPPRSTRWYVRLVAPESIRDLVDKVEFRQSTGHSDIHKAKPVGLALLAEKRREWASLEAPGRAGSDRLRRQADDPDRPAHRLHLRGEVYASLAVDENDRTGPDGLDDDALRGIEEFCAMTDVAMRSVLAQGPASPRWSGLVQTVLDWCWAIGYELETSDPLFVKLVRAFAASKRTAPSAFGSATRATVRPRRRRPPAWCY